MPLWSRLFKQRHTRLISPLYTVGFHGDTYLLHLVNDVALLVETFVETGTNVGTTARYVAETYPDILVYTCEPDPEAFTVARRNLADYPNVRPYNLKSPDFLRAIHEQHPSLRMSVNLYFLDAHGHGFRWRLREEVAFITTTVKAAYILIDDFKVPGLDCFGYDVYQDQECSFEYIADVLNPEQEYTLYYPNYTERTSKHHPLRGWGLIEFGHGDTLRVSDYLQDKVHVVRVESSASGASRV